MGKVVCPWDTLINFVTDAFVGYGIPREDAEICTDILLDRTGEVLKATAVTALSRFILTELKQVFKIRLLTLRWLRKPLAPQ